MYLTYEDYFDMGGTLEDEAAFEELEFEARSIIDWWTFNRLQQEQNYPEAVKRCMFKLIKLIQEKEIAMSPVTKGSSENSVITAGIVRESNDDVLTEYNTLSARQSMDMARSEIKTIVSRYLQGVRNSLGHKVLYRGVYPDE